MENANGQSNTKYEQENLQKNLDQEKELPQADNRSDSKSPKKSRSNSYSRHDISRRNSSDRSDFEQGQKKGEWGYSQNVPSSNQKDPNLKQPKLDFLIFISTKIKDSLLENKILDSIISQIGGISMDFDLNFKIPEYNGCLLKIKSDDIRKKRDATQHLLEFIVKHNLDHNPNEPQKKGEKIAIIIMIPNGLVSMIIGTRGKQISNLIEESQASIVINQPIYKMTYRTVTISGYPEGIAKGIMLIQQIMEERYNEVNNIEFECPPLNVVTTQTNVKIVLPEYIVDNIYAKRHGNGSFVNLLKEKFDVTTKVYQEHKNRQLDKKEVVCSFKGTINHVQDAIMELSHKIKDDIRNTYEGKESYQLKILINKVFVTKLIGAGGCMIQEIANFAKGASIKIMSNKNDEKKNNFHDIPLCIAGGFYSIQDATCIIIEQMECFKNGGPVLKSGKSLHDNIAVQFMNSIFTNALPGQNEDAHTYTLKERFNQQNEENSGNNNNINNNNNSDDINRYENNQNEEQIIPEIHQREKFKDYSEQNIIPEYSNRSHYYNRSRSRSRSRNRERSRSRERYRRDNQRSRSKKYSSRSNSRNYGRSRSRNNDYRKRRGDNERERDNNNLNRNYSRPYSLFSYTENGVTKINTYFTVPDHLVSLLIGKKGENVRAIMNSTGAVVTFCKEYNDDGKINTSNGIARLCNLKGTIQQNMEAMGKILELVVKFESGNNQQANKEK